MEKFFNNDLTKEELSLRMEQNFISYGRRRNGINGVVFTENETIAQTVSNLSAALANRVYRFNCEHSTPLQNQINTVLETFVNRNSSMIWSVGVLTPESVGNALIQLGLKRLDNFSGMVRDSGNSECGKTDLEIKVLDDPRNIVDWLKAFQSSFHLSKEAEDHYHKLIQPLLGRSQADVWLIGYVGDKPACSAGYSIENDVIMIYSVCTLPEFRKRGYGKQITEAAIKEGLKHKKLPVTLYSTAMALPLYKSMGFKPVYDMEMYLFEPRGK